MARFSASGGRSSLLPGNTASVDSQRQIALTAAHKYNVSPQTLWGVYGTESGFGANLGPSSAGAVGPMQFEPGTWQKYGGEGNVNSLVDAMPAAAHYLHDLGADTNPTSAATVRALNAYNGNGGGSNRNTPYVQSVLKFGAQLGVGGANATVPVTSGGSGGGGGGDLLSVLSDIVTGNISDLAATLAIAAAEGIKDMAVGFGDLVVIPLWHRNQQAVYWYVQNILFPSGGQGSEPIIKTWPVNAAFWGIGYGLLFTDPESGTPKPTSPRRSRIARHVRRFQSVPARQTIVRPSRVKEKTPPKPPTVHSKVSVNHVGTLATTRNRPVRVTGSIHDRDRINSDRGTVSEVPVKDQGQVSRRVPQGTVPPPTVTHSGYSGRHRPPARRRSGT